MAKIEDIEARLWRWAEAVKSRGADGSGYPVMCTLHQDWMPPSPGITPSMKVAPANDARQTHRLVRQLSERMQVTLVVHYIKRLSHADAACLLDCQVDTVKCRIEAAHHELARRVDAERAGFCNIH
jgi:DNA-directed RNA polymerase specialized sigma24 family protein